MSDESQRAAKGFVGESSRREMALTGVRQLQMMIVAVGLFGVIGCSRRPLAPSNVRDAGFAHVETPTRDAGTVIVPADAGRPPQRFIDLPAASSAELGAFATSDTCASCHANASTANAMRDDADRPIAPYNLWRSSMMANAARDPLYRAVLSAEIAATPSAKTAIQNKCLGCHAPMAARTTADVSLEALYADSTNTSLGLDGVSCTVCHQIEAEGLGTPASFSGHFTVGTDREMFGPHATPFSRPMQMHTGYTPVEGDQILDSALCGSCHTLYTDALDPAGIAVGASLPEQTPFLEWRNSAAPAEGATCQSCHAPRVDADNNTIATRIARNPGGMDFPPIDDRSPYGRHVFVGANTLVPTLLRDNPSLNAPAPRDAFDATIEAARAQLRSAARLSVSVARSGEMIQADVTIENLTGHKLPTAHPIRRMWLHVVVRDKNDVIVFESGAHDDRHRIIGQDSTPLAFESAAGPVAEHVDVVTDPDTAAIYEAVMGDAAGAPTTLLIRGARFIKDNRILPRGWRPNDPEAANIGPVGVDGDSNFAAGRDTVRYVAQAPAAQAPYRVSATLRYVAISPRWYAELVQYDTREVADFVRMYETANLPPETIAEASNGE